MIGDEVTEGGVNKAGVFHNISRIDDSRLAAIFAREVLGSLVHKELLSPEWAERLLSRLHAGFNVHSRVQARTKTESEPAGKYMIRLVLGLDQLVDIIRTVKLRLTSLSVIFYASSRWLEGIILTKMRLLPGDTQNQITIRSAMGKPIKTYDPSCKGARAYKNLTKEIISTEKQSFKKSGQSLPKKISSFWDTGASPRHAIKK